MIDEAKRTIKDILIEDAENSGRLPCPRCGSRMSKVVSTRFRKGSPTKGSGIRRLRECKACKYSYETLEVPQSQYDELLNLKWSLIKFVRSTLSADSFFNHLRSLLTSVDPTEKIPRSTSRSVYEKKRP